MSESTIRRWVDGRKLSSHRTAGGHRRIGVPDLVRYAREEGLAWESPELIGLGSADLSNADPVGGLAAALGGGDVEESEAIALRAFVNGIALFDIFDGLLAPAMAQVGALWTGGEAGVLAEHRATAICLRLIHRLGELVDGGGGGAAVGGALPGDPYSIPSAMAKQILREAGLDAFDLGPDTPLHVIGEAARERAAALAWISANHVADPVSTRAQIVALVEGCASVGTVFVIGGRAAATLELPDLPGTHMLRSMGELREIASTVVGAASART